MCPKHIDAFTVMRYYVTTLINSELNLLNFKGNKMQVETKQGRLTEALLNGEQLTVAQIKARFDIANPTATISDIRFAGYAVYANQRKNSKGEVKTFYRMGKPTRKIVAAGYRALAMGLVE